MRLRSPGVFPGLYVTASSPPLRLRSPGVFPGLFVTAQSPPLRLRSPGVFPGLDAHCGAVLSTFVLGSTLTFSALLMKLWRVRSVFLHLTAPMRSTLPQV